MFPAYVGMSPGGGLDYPNGARVPRIRGDEPGISTFVKGAIECSPHTWG